MSKITPEMRQALIGPVKPKGTPGCKSGCVKHGGRQVGSRNKIDLALPAPEMKEQARAMIWQAFAKLGSVEWLVKLGKDRPELFLQVLSRVLPAAPREDAQPLVNVDLRQQQPPLSDFEAARRIAFCLAKAVYTSDESSSQAIEAHQPRWAPDAPPDRPFEAFPAPRERYPVPGDASKMPDPAYRDHFLTRETAQQDLSSYRGSPQEHAHEDHAPKVQTQRGVPNGWHRKYGKA